MRQSLFATRWGLAGLGTLLLRLATVCVSAASPKRVLRLHSFGRDFPPCNTISGTFRAKLVRQSPSPLDLFEASLESARFIDPAEDGPLVDYLRALFQGSSPADGVSR